MFRYSIFRLFQDGCCLDGCTPLFVVDVSVVEQMEKKQETAIFNGAGKVNVLNDDEKQAARTVIADIYSTG